MSNEQIVTPRGLLHHDCVRASDDPRPPVKKYLNAPNTFQALAPATPTGWIESATFAPAVPLGYMSVTWTVPEPPSDPRSLIYLFPALQGPRNRSILQPVLQWGHNGKFGGDCWTIASWFCCDDSGATYSCEQLEVEPGKTIIGTIQGSATPDEPDLMDWTVTTAIEGDDRKMPSLLVKNMTVLFLFAIAGALEAYGPGVGDARPPLRGTRADLPFFPSGHSTRFEKIDLAGLDDHHFIANWHSRRARGGDCFDVEVSDDRKSVTLWY